MVRQLDRCPGTLKEGFSTYSPSCRRNLFGNKKVDHILPYNSPSQSEDYNEYFIENRKRISISGVQEKLSLILIKNKLTLTEAEEQGTYILKPIPRDLKLVDQVPANEHLTMQIASQIYNIKTAENALIFFLSGEPAYITKRFDVRSDGTKWGVEDFASLSQRSIDTNGSNFKYGDISYEEIADLIHKYVGAYQIEIEKFYKLIIFNFLFSNGDAHLKNFSLIETPQGDYILSPAYDLLNTRIHVSDTYFALKKGLFKDGSARVPRRSSFIEFGKKIGIKEKRVLSLLEIFDANKQSVHSLIARSFLSDKAKKGYLINFNMRYNMLNSK